MTYTLIAFFMTTGHWFVEARHLTLQQCAQQVALYRMDLIAAGLEDRIGEVRFLCKSETGHE